MREREDDVVNSADMWDIGPAVDALPRELEPGDLLEERTIRALREAGLLGRRRAVPRAWVVGSAAAAIALFASGLALGQWVGSRSAADLLVAGQNANLQQTAQAVERAGASYVQALSALAESRQSRTSADALYARETALTTLHQAANQIVRISPNDPVAANILQGLDQANARPPERRNTRRVIWF